MISRLRVHRENTLKLNLDDLARITGLPRFYFSRVETKKPVPKKHEERIARAYKLTPGKLAAMQEKAK